MNPQPDNGREINPIRMPDLTPAEIYAIKALQLGEANRHQQQLALDTIITTLCGTYDTPYRSDVNQTHLAIGQQRIGQMLVKIVNVDSQRLNLDKISLESIPEAETEQNDENNE